MTIRDKTCCFTGHRDIPQAQIPVLTKKVTATIQMLAAQGIIYYGAGGALGFDTISATAVLIYNNLDYLCKALKNRHFRGYGQPNLLPIYYFWGKSLDMRSTARASRPDGAAHR
ncbi:hypothetical protein [Lawsonibacter sp. JLR.KK007]|uniref:hypothetical protein n=1 Tax=Lawsonibacter sp. JLR.KK007 TaxID=3114293 RepID=UPI002FEEB86E